ncbi:transport permease protein [Alphaproteobacteria bacterium]|nr:transport permease protein [Alphaproteobacteria bacterium]GHS96060.1 transport permease protein [Alphaproteobacteria bacterium]
MILKGFIRKEIIQTLRDPHLGMAVIIMPVLQLLLFGYALTNEVKNIRLDVYAEPRDVLVQNIYDHALASRWFAPVKKHKANPIDAIQSGEADAVLVAPPGGLTRAAGRNEEKIQLLVNASDVLRAQAADIYLKSIAQSLEPKGEKTPHAPLSVSVRMLYNPSMTSSTFTLPGIMSMLLTFLVMVLTCTSIAKEKERGTFEMIISAPIRRTDIILGKTIPFALVGVWNVFIALMASRFFFSLPLRGSLVAFGFVSLCYVYTALMAGVLMSTFVKNQQQSMMCNFMILFIAMMLSGCFFSVDNMPLPLRLISYVNPLAHYTFLVRNILLKGGDFMYLIQYSSALLGVGIVLAFFAFRRFRISL